MRYILMALLVSSFTISYSQSPQKRYTYTVDSMRYYKDKVSGEYMMMRYNGMPTFVTIDYGQNKITIKGGLNGGSNTFSIEEYHPKETKSGQESYNFFCLDEKSSPYSITLGLFYATWNNPLLSILRDKQCSIYYLRRFD